MVAALSYMGSKIISEADLLSKIIPQNEEELRESIRNAVYYGDKGQVTVGGIKMALPQYAGYIAGLLFQEDKNPYSLLLKERFLKPPALQIRKFLEEKQDFLKILATCLEQNKTVYEI